nr:hypothetical transcript [Hymenolepis microstoma]
MIQSFIYCSCQRKEVGRLRRRASRRVYNAFWKTGNVNVDDLDTEPSPPDPQSNRQRSEDQSQQTTEYSIHEDVQPVEVVPLNLAEDLCHTQLPIREFEVREGTSFSGPYTNPAFVPEIEIHLLLCRSISLSIL